MKITETVKKYRNMSVDNLRSELKKIENECIINSLKVKSGRDQNFSSVNKLKKNIARIKTILNEKSLGENNG